MTVQDAVREHREEILRIAARHGATNVRVFGSVARGTAGPDSDLDLLIDVTGETTPWFPGGLIADLEDLLGCKVDVVTEDTLHPRIRSRVLVEARALEPFSSGLTSGMTLAPSADAPVCHPEGEAEGSHAPHPVSMRSLGRRGSLGMTVQTISVTATHCVRDQGLYFEQILECIDRVQRFTAGGLERLGEDQMTQDAVMRNLQVLTESCIRMSSEIRERRRAIDWKGIAALRNVVVHDYLDLDLEKIWEIIQTDLRPLAAVIGEELARVDAELQEKKPEGST